MGERKCRENFYPSRFRNKFFSVVSQNSNKVNEKTHVTETRKVSRIRTRPRRLTIARVMTEYTARERSTKWAMIIQKETGLAKDREY